MFLAFWKGTLPDTLDELSRIAPTVSPDLPVTDLFRRFQQGEPHFAVVVQHDDKPLGFVTLDNLLGALVGEIRDEFREVGNDWIKLDDGSLLGKGTLPIFTLERALGVDVDEREIDTVGGLVIQELGDFPTVGQRIPFEQFDVVVKRMNGPKILLVRVYPRQRV